MKKHNLLVQNSPGLTLVEILVVIALIGILASIFAVMLGAARDKARTASAMSSMKSMITEAALPKILMESFRAICAVIKECPRELLLVMDTFLTGTLKDFRRRYMTN